jgi:hypothetical protein
VVHGEEGFARVDVEGVWLGKSGTLMRRLPAALSDDADHVRQYVAHLRADHDVLIVAVRR